MNRFHALALAVAMIGPAAGVRAAVTDSSPHKIQFVTVQLGVKLEVLDWGGNGRPLIFLPGLGATAHDFDKFAVRFTSKYHVYGVTRRGAGSSDTPALTVANFAADRLGDDVVAVMDALNITHPILAGHSIAGSELSSIASRYPKKVSGLVYLDAAYVYAFYTPGIMPLYLQLTIKEMSRRIDRLSKDGASSEIVKNEVDRLYERNLSQLETDLRLTRRFLGSPDTANSRLLDADSAILAGVQKYGSVDVPVLAIYAIPKNFPPGANAFVQADVRAHDAIDSKTADLFSSGNPKAKVVTIPNSDHDVFNSNPAQVERELNQFIQSLPR